MKSTATLFDQRPPKQAPPTIRSERDEQIQNFAGRGVIGLRDRTTKELRQATAGEIALLPEDCPTRALYPFYREYERARSFSRYFWWAVKGGKSLNSNH